MGSNRSNAPTIDFTTRFGKPRFQRYKVSAGLQVSIEYEVDGKVAALEISAPEYRGYSPNSDTIPSEAVDQLLESLLPGITNSGVAHEALVCSTYPGFSREVRGLPATVLNRDYPLSQNRTKMIAATVIFKASTLSDPLHAIISSFRAPEYEQFDAGTGLRIAVTYARDASIQLLSISANASPLARDHFSLPIEQDAAETLLHELLPKSVRSGEPQRSVRAFGAFISKRERYRHATIFRNYSDGHMIAVGASWPIDPSLVNAGGSK